MWTQIILKKILFKLINYVVFGKTMENVRKHIVTKRKKKLFGVRTKLSYYKVFHRTSFSNRNRKKEMLRNKPVYLEVSITN